MLGDGTRDARRTDRYLNGLMDADARQAPEAPADADLDPAIQLAVRELRTGLVRVHPSFRFEESLSARLAASALRMRAGLPAETAATVRSGAVMPFRRRSSATSEVAAPPIAPELTTVVAGAVAPPRAIWPAAAFRRFPDMTARPSRPLIVGGVGVASAALSIGAVYVAWRHSHPASSRMGRAARAAHGRSGHSGHGRRSGVINGILGVVS
jgi:hypothetical protein